MQRAPASSSVSPRAASRLDPTLAPLALGLRFLALAVVAGSGMFLLKGAESGARLVAGILASALLGLAHYGITRRWPALRTEVFVLAQTAVWIYLLHVSGGQRSPLFIGLLLEVPLAGSLLGRRGCVVGVAATAGAYLAYAAFFSPRLEPDAVALVTGFIAVTGILTWLVLGILFRQRAALAMRAEDLASELRLLGDYLGDAFFTVDDLGRMASANQAGAALLGIDAQAVVGRPWQEVLRPEAGTAARIAQTLVEGEAQRGAPLVLHRRDGAAIELRGDVWVSPSQRGRRLHVLLDQRPAVQATDDPVRRLGEAAACVAHQIKNSLQALSSLAYSAGDDPSRRRPEQDTARFPDALRSLSELVDDVLAVAGSARPPAEEIPLAQAVSSALLLTRPGGVRVTMGPAEQELRVWTHRGRLVHALYNLLDNACRVTPAGGAVHVRLERLDSNVRIEIVDGGPGLPPGVDGARGPVPSQGGAGLGLMAARRFLEASGGSLSFACEPGGGTHCSITLPIGAPPPTMKTAVE